MDFVLESLKADWNAFLAFSPRLAYAAAVLVVFFLLARFLSRALGRVMHRSERLRTDEKFIARLVLWTIRLVGLVAALGVMGFKGVAASMLATGGVVAIVLGFAFREIGENLLAGIFLSFSRPFEVGDLITSGDLTGTVRAIDIRSVHIRTADACDVFVPSAQIFRQELYNYTRDGIRRPSFKVGVAYHDDPSEVLELLRDAMQGVANLLAEPAPFVSISQFSDSWITYECFFWIDVTLSPRGLGDVSNDVMQACWRSLSDRGMTFSTDVATAVEVRSAPGLQTDFTV